LVELQTREFLLVLAIGEMRLLNITSMKRLMIGRLTQSIFFAFSILNP
jgi:hypothetical protein